MKRTDHRSPLTYHLCAAYLLGVLWIAAFCTAIVAPATPFFFGSLTSNDPLLPLDWRLMTHDPGSNIPKYLYQDGAMTVPATIAGHTILAAKDPLTGAKVMDFAGNPTLQFDGGVPVIRFVSGSSQYGIRDGGSFVNRDLWIRYRQRVPAYGVGIVSDRNPTSGTDQTNPDGAVIKSSEVELPADFTSRHCPSVLTTWMVRHGPTGSITLGQEGTETHTTTGGATGTSDLAFLGCRYVFGVVDFASIDVESVWCGRGLTTAERAAVNAAVNPRSAAQLFVCEGDSLTRGFNGFVGVLPGVGGTYPDQLQVLRPTSLVINNAVWGSTMAALAARGAELDAMFRPGGILIVMIGSNNLFVESLTAATLRTELNSYVTDRNTVGWEVHIGTITPRSDAGVPGTFETQRGIFNAAVVSNPAPAAGYFDFGGDSRIGDAGDETNATYFLGDNVHLNATGCGVEAEIVHAAVPLSSLSRPSKIYARSSKARRIQFSPVHTSSSSVRFPFFDPVLFLSQFAR